MFMSLNKASCVFQVVAKTDAWIIDEYKVFCSARFFCTADNLFKKNLMMTFPSACWLLSETQYESVKRLY